MVDYVEGPFDRIVEVGWPTAGDVSIARLTATVTDIRFFASNNPPYTRVTFESFALLPGALPGLHNHYQNAFLIAETDAGPAVLDQRFLAPSNADAVMHDPYQSGSPGSGVADVRTINHVGTGVAISRSEIDYAGDNDGGFIEDTTTYWRLGVAYLLQTTTITPSAITARVRGQSTTGDVYFVVVPQGDRPSIDQIIAGLDSTGSPAVSAANAPAPSTVNGIVEVTLSGLSSSTRYLVYAAHQETDGSKSLARGIDRTTTA